MKQLTFNGENGRPDWSPDGKMICYISIVNNGAWIAVMNADGSNQQLLVEGAAPDWSPDGKKIQFSTGRSGRNELWAMDADGSNEKKISDIDAGPFPGRGSWQPVR